MLRAVFVHRLFGACRVEIGPFHKIIKPATAFASLKFGVIETVLQPLFQQVVTIRHGNLLAGI